ncbi:3,4-dihydroxy-2-butanone-4-phosphate synthase [Streptomyces sp. NPDC005820]|uniref:3,4-dihydroxy-2-butanone-4-phosphate synthase n=1 Tax=Streptomyces sp. NPDC005820 TaxID=3157069 RepID=UPI0033DA41AB
MIVVTDDADRENEGDFVVAAELVGDEQMAFLVRHSTGIVCAPMPQARADELGAATDGGGQHRLATEVVRCATASDGSACRAVALAWAADKALTWVRCGREPPLS